jgi:uncharacterized protein (TIGR02246 family)
MLADPSATPTQDTAQITALIDAAVRHQSEPDPFLALHAEGVVVVNIAGRRVIGRADLETAMRGALASSLADVTTTVKIDDIRFVRPDVAIVSCTKYVHDAREGQSEALPQAGAMSYVVEAVGGRWRIALAQTTPVRS